MTPLGRLFSLAFAASLIALCSAACSGESEGQRCELTDDPGGPDNSPGTSDCANNLKCTRASELGGAASQYASAQSDQNFGICCPYDRALATTSICSLQPSAPGGDAGLVDGGSSDGSSDGAAGDSAVSDSPSDAPADSSNDAPGDAPSDAADAAG